MKLTNSELTGLKVGPVVILPLMTIIILVVLLLSVGIYQCTFISDGVNLVGAAVQQSVPSEEIQPKDVYYRVDTMTKVIEFGIRILYLEAAVSGILLIAVAAQILVKILILGPLVREVRLSRLANEETLKYAEQHGMLSDAKWKRMEVALGQTEQVLEEANAILGHLDQRVEVAATQALTAATEAKELKEAMARVEHQTNSMTQSMVAGASREGVTEGRRQVAEESVRSAIENKMEEVGSDVKDVKDTTQRIESAIKSDEGS